MGAVDIPAGETVNLKPGSIHIMFMGLRVVFKPGEVIPVSFTFEKAGDVTAEMKVGKVEG